MKSHSSREWTVLAKITRIKTVGVFLRTTPEQKKAIETMAIELRLDITALIEIGLVAVYESLGNGQTAKYRALADDPAIWREMAAKSRERAEQERQKIRGRQ